jgi:hypothetical protein
MNTALSNLSVGSGCAIDAGLAPAFVAQFFSMGASAPVEASAGEQTGPVAAAPTLPQPTLECDNQEDRSSKAGANSEVTE